MFSLKPLKIFAFVSFIACGGLLTYFPAIAADKLAPQVAEAAIAAKCPTCTYVWKGIQIAAPRHASNGEIAAAGLPPHAIVYPVRATYTETAGFKRDYTWNYYVYKDEFGAWMAQSNATVGNVESQPY